MDDQTLILHQTPPGLLRGFLADLYEEAYHPGDVYMTIAADISKSLLDPLYKQVFEKELEELCEELQYPFEFVDMELQNIYEWISQVQENIIGLKFVQVFFLEYSTTMVVYERNLSNATAPVTVAIPTESYVLRIAHRLGFLVA